MTTPRKTVDWNFREHLAPSDLNFVANTLAPRDEAEQAEIVEKLINPFEADKRDTMLEAPVLRRVLGSRHGVLKVSLPLFFYVVT